MLVHRSAEFVLQLAEKTEAKPGSLTFACWTVFHDLSVIAPMDSYKPNLIDKINVKGSDSN